ncbi:hypothetical protein OL229_16200 [Neisseriaceae bacterium JH1-16]|nr:hypothetical protein [Neisseriaceae bacterium JH1-16]
MKHLMMVVTLVASTGWAAVLAADVGVSVQIGQPNFYGRIDIGGYPPPQVIYRQPIAIEQVPMDRQPIYLRVPLDHAKHWRTHCREYNACNERVLFVQDSWYNQEYAPRYQEHHHDYKDDHDQHRHDIYPDQGNGY